VCVCVCAKHGLHIKFLYINKSHALHTATHTHTQAHTHTHAHTHTDTHTHTQTDRHTHIHPTHTHITPLIGGEEGSNDRIRAINALLNSFAIRSILAQGLASPPNCVCVCMCMCYVCVCVCVCVRVCIY